MSGIQDLLNDLAEFESTPESAGYELRHDLAGIIARHLAEKNWTQAQLADAMGAKAPFITRLIHSSSNCTFEVAGRVFFALGLKVKLVEERPVASLKFDPLGQGHLDEKIPTQIHPIIAGGGSEKARSVIASG